MFNLDIIFGRWPGSLFHNMQMKIIEEFTYTNKYNIYLSYSILTIISSSYHHNFFFCTYYCAIISLATTIATILYSNSNN